jgi:hypothetical protein
MIVVSLSTSQNHTPRNYQNLSFCNTGRRSLRAKFLPFYKKKRGGALRGQRPISNGKCMLYLVSGGVYDFVAKTQAS